jgi:hypothetical protein
LCTNFAGFTFHVLGSRSLDAVLQALSDLRSVADVITRGIVVSTIHLAFLGTVEVYGYSCLAAKIAYPVDDLIVEQEGRDPILFAL